MYLFPPAPTFTEKYISIFLSQVYITGATSNSGLALAKILYALYATLYIRSPSCHGFFPEMKLPPKRPFLKPDGTPDRNDANLTMRTIASRPSSRPSFCTHPCSAQPRPSAT
ncbi:hypothetical protein PMIN06_006332 [Paraphaeosphaeria minitans]